MFTKLNNPNENIYLLRCNHKKKVEERQAKHISRWLTNHVCSILDIVKCYILTVTRFMRDGMFLCPGPPFVTDGALPTPCAVLINGNRKNNPAAPPCEISETLQFLYINFIKHHERRFNEEKKIRWRIILCQIHWKSFEWFFFSTNLLL